jgi:DHA2 family multidrug resistance protein
MLLMPLIGRLITRVDPRPLIAFGLALTATALFFMSRLNLQVDFWTIAWARVLQAAGFAFLFIPINTIAFAGVPPGKYHNGSALLNLSRNLGGSVGIAVLTTLLTRRAQFHQSMLVEHIGPYEPSYAGMVHGLQQRMLLQGGSSHEALLKAQAVIANLVQQQAQLLSYLDDFLILAIIFAALVPVVFLMKRPLAPAQPTAAH